MANANAPQTAPNSVPKVKRPSKRNRRGKRQRAKKQKLMPYERKDWNEKDPLELEKDL